MITMEKQIIQRVKLICSIVFRIETISPIIRTSRGVELIIFASGE